MVAVGEMVDHPVEMDHQAAMDQVEIQVEKEIADQEDPTMDLVTEDQEVQEIVVQEDQMMERVTEDQDQEQMMEDTVDLVLDQMQKQKLQHQTQQPQQPQQQQKKQKLICQCLLCKQ